MENSASSEFETRINSAVQAAPPSLSILDVLRISRLGLMVSHIWVYLLPAIHSQPQSDGNFWIGLVYVTVPLGLLIYGWNDFFDWDVDHISTRKLHRTGGAAFGSSLSPSKLASLPRLIVVAQLPFVVYWAVAGQWLLVGWVALMVFGNALYNGPGVRMSRVPVLAELTATGIYLLILWLGALIHSPIIPFWIWLFATLSILNFQIMGALVDVHEDAKVGKRTFAVTFGQTASTAIVIASLLIKAGLTYAFTGQLSATALMLVGVVLVAAGFSFPGVSRCSTAYSAFIVLDWSWLALLIPL